MSHSSENPLFHFSSSESITGSTVTLAQQLSWLTLALAQKILLQMMAWAMLFTSQDCLRMRNEWMIVKSVRRDLLWPASLLSPVYSPLSENFRTHLPSEPIRSGRVRQPTNQRPAPSHSPSGGKFVIVLGEISFLISAETQDNTNRPLPSDWPKVIT